MRYAGNHRKPKGRHRKGVIRSVSRRSVARAISASLVAGAMLTGLTGSSAEIPDKYKLVPKSVQDALSNRGKEIVAMPASRSGERNARPAVVAPPSLGMIKPTVSVVKAVPKPVVKMMPTPALYQKQIKSVGNGKCGSIGVVANAQAMCNQVYALFPVNTIGGRRAGSWGDHPTGHALDIMVGAYNPLGDTIAAWAIANGAKYGVTYVIWRQRTWFMDRGGWTSMADRGSISANHYDHVHVSFR